MHSGLSSKWIRYTLFVVLNIVWFAFLFWVSLGFKKVELDCYDFLLRFSKDPQVEEKIIVVGIDDSTLKQLDVAWPIPRSLYGHVVKVLWSLGARVVGFDILFAQPSDSKEDQAFVQACTQTGIVVQSMVFNYGDGYVSSSGNMAALGIKTFPFFLDPFDVHTPVGFINAPMDRDGVFRRLPLVIRHRRKLFYSLPMRMMMDSRAISEEQVAVHADDIVAGDMRIPLDDKGRCLIHWAKQGSRAFRQYRFYDLLALDSSFAAQGPVSPFADSDIETFRDSLVLIGYTPTISVDTGVSPYESNIHRIFVHANMLSTLLSGAYIRVVPLWIVMVITVCLLLILSIVSLQVIEYSARVASLPLLSKEKKQRFFLAAGVLSRRATPFALFLCCGVFLLGYVCLAFYLFRFRGIYITVFAPVLTLALHYTVLEAYHLYQEFQRRLLITKTFGQFVHPVMIKRLQKSPKALDIGGEKKQLSILFSDIEGFTYKSEQMESRQLVEFLNEYLDAMSFAVLSSEGTIDKFVGDAIVAFYGAPLTLPEHPRHACESALMMQRILATQNKKWESTPVGKIHIRIGINTGYAVVGCIGSEQHKNYTVIGDTVNVAARLENLNKVYGTNIIVNETTYQAVQSNYLFRHLDRVILAGKTNVTNVYELVDEAVLGEQKSKLVVPMFHEALYLYYSKQWQEALEMFSQLVQQWNDAPSGVFVRRCQELLASEPSADWNGVFVPGTK